MLSLMFSYILTFSVIYYYTDPRQHGIFFVFFNDKKMQIVADGDVICASILQHS